MCTRPYGFIRWCCGRALYSGALGAAVMFLSGGGVATAAGPLQPGAESSGPEVARESTRGADVGEKVPEPAGNVKVVDEVRGERPVGSTAGSEAEPLRRRAHLVTVPVPIAGTVDTQVKRQLERLAASEVRGEDRPVLVLEFRSESGTTGEGSEFERCLSLARYLAGERMSGIRTVAFLPDSVTGHAVLPILACEEIVMAEEASLGAAGQGEAFIDDTIRGSYREIAERRRTIPVAVVLGMLDPALNVYKVQIADGARYVLDAELEQLQKETAARSVETLSRAGDLARFSGKDLRVRFGFVSHLAGDREQLTAALGLPRGALDQDPSAGGAWHALQVDLRGPINAKQISWIERSLRDRLAQGDINLVCLAIDSGGGSLVDSLRLANYLASLDRAV
ncbi:MAG: hypothetical protein AB7O38_20170, partial [Pirellulaceae bacterium]